MKVKYVGIFPIPWTFEFPKKGSGLPYNDKHCNGPSEQRWIRTCIIRDYFNNSSWILSTSDKEDGKTWDDITVIDYDIISNQSEVWYIDWKK